MRAVTSMRCEITGCPLPAVRPVCRPDGSATVVVCSSCAEDLMGVFGYDAARVASRVQLAELAGV